MLLVINMRAITKDEAIWGLLLAFTCVFGTSQVVHLTRVDSVQAFDLEGNN